MIIHLRLHHLHGVKVQGWLRVVVGIKELGLDAVDALLLLVDLLLLVSCFSLSPLLYRNSPWTS